MAHLVFAWNNFVELPKQHHSDLSEFASAIHMAQNLLMAYQLKRIAPEKAAFRIVSNELLISEET